MIRYEAKYTAFLASSVYTLKRNCLFPEHIRSLDNGGWNFMFFPEQCRSYYVRNRLTHNLFRSISVHVTDSHYLCLENNLKSKDMAGIIVDMSKIKQMLQLSEAGQSNRKIAGELGINKETVNNYMQLVRNGRLNIRQLLKMDDPELERRFHAGNPAYADSRMKTFLEELPVMKTSLSQKHVTRFLVWQEYIGRHPDGYGKSQFFYHLKQNLIAAKGPSAVLTDTYLPGEKLYVDFAGDKLEYIDPETGEIIKVEVFVATLPYSDYAYAVCVPSQKLEDFVHAIRMCLEYMGGVPLILVTDNLKAAVVKADRYEPKLNKGLEDMGNFYHFAVVPCQPKSPTQKALVEDEVRLVYRRIYAKLRNSLFYSLQDLNKAVLALLEDHNRTRMQKRPYSREERFNAVEKDKLQPLPAGTYEIRYYADVHVQQNGYVEISKDHRYYSVPYIYLHKKARIIFTRSIVKVYIDGQCVAAHPRIYGWGYTTVKEHLASNNRAITDRSPEYYIGRACRVSDTFGVYIKEIFSSTRSSNPPEVYYRTCDMLLRLSSTCERDRFDKTCRLCLTNGIYSGKRFEAILENSMLLPEDVPNDAPVPSNHENMRGAGYYK